MCVFAIWFEFVIVATTEPTVATPLAMPNFYVYYITRNCKEFRQSLTAFEAKWVPVLHGSVHREFSLQLDKGPWQVFFMQSWKPSSCIDGI